MLATIHLIECEPPAGRPDCYPRRVTRLETSSDALRHPLTFCLVLAALATGAYLAGELYLLDGGLGFPLDDSWIHLQFARNLAAGEGLSYNPGQPVTGSTAPLWTALLSLAFALPGDPVIWAKAFGISLYLLVVPATYRFARELSLGRGLAAVAAALTASTSWLVWSSLSGMEIPLFTVLSLAGMALHMRERRRGPGTPYSALVLALAALARPEGFLLVAAAFLDRLIGLRASLRGPNRARALRTLAAWVALAVIVLLPTMLYYRAIGDGFLPTTYSAKSAGLQRWVPSASYLYVVLGIFFPMQPIMSLLALGGAVAIARDGMSEEGSGFLPMFWMLGLPLAYSLISGLGAGVLVGNFGRYYFPLFPVVIVLGMLAVGRLAGDAIESWAAGPRRVLLALLAALVLLPTLIDLGKGIERYTRSVLNVEDSDVAMARWLEGRLPAEAVLAVNDIGALRYMLPNEVVDLAGIGNPEIRTYFDEATRAGRPWRFGIEAFLVDKKPDYLVVFPSWFPDLTADELSTLR